MCISGGSNFNKRPVKLKKELKSIKIKKSKLSKEVLKHGDPNFKDEHKVELKKLYLIDKFFKWLLNSN